VDSIPIRSTKYDHSLHWRYEAILLEEGSWGWLTLIPHGQPIESQKGEWLTLHPCLRWHWRDRWWDAMLVFREDGRWLEWYCNIVTPPTRENGKLRFHDLDLDVTWHRERGILIADTEEFEQNARQMAYPPSLIETAWDNARRVRQMMLKRQWRFSEDPFSLHLDGELARFNVGALKR
jgi:protein associated with RNAse G/E